MDQLSQLKSEPAPQAHGDVIVYTFYQFIADLASQDVEARAEDIRTLGESLQIFGLVIFGREGINTTISGSQENLDRFTARVAEILHTSAFRVKKSVTDIPPFKNFKVKVREEIVSLGKPEIVPPNVNNNHLSPEDWQRTLEEEDVILLDTRNWYEMQIGKFQNAIDPQLDEFNEFPEYLQKANLPKDKKILIYCTGGIRCEKAAIEMQTQGFEKVYQLDGGILNYLEKFPREKFEGECFVFDHRVAVDQDLKASVQVKMCPHCGQPARDKINCRKCDFEAWVCGECLQDEAKQTCSKNCAHHYRRAADKKGRKQMQGYRVEVMKKRLSMRSGPRTH